MKEVLIVDGYNMIGAWEELSLLSEESMEEARERLIEYLSEYKGFSGRNVTVVFDAHQVPGRGAAYKQNGVEVIYTKEKETADECIERLAAGSGKTRKHVYVATSDYTEQRVTFGQGALRISARELWIEIKSNQKQINEVIGEKMQTTRNTFDSTLSDELKDIFEKWRRGKP